MTYQVDQHDDAAAVLRQAADFLESRPAEHNLVFNLLHYRASTGEPGRYWVVRRGPGPVGVVLQSPLGFRATSTPMAPAAVRAAVEAVAAAGVTLPGVEAEAATAAVFAGHWTEVCRTGARPTLGTRLLRLEDLTLPERIAGRFRTAVRADHDVVGEWADAFSDEVGQPRPAAEHVTRQIDTGRIALWEVEGEPVCMVGCTDMLAHVARIGPVYTPPVHRRRGYAAACVGQSSARIVDAGGSCILYTDLANPTSNSVYRSLGYRTVSENVRYEFDAPLST